MATYRIEVKYLYDRFGPSTSTFDTQSDSIVKLREKLIRKYGDVASKIKVYQLKRGQNKVYSADGRRVIYSGDAIVFIGQLSFIFKTRPVEVTHVSWFSDKTGVEYYVEKSTGELTRRV